MNGGTSTYGLYVATTGNITYNAGATINGGTGNIGGDGGALVYDAATFETDGNITINGSIISNGGAGTAAGGDGGSISIGGNTATQVSLGGGAVLRTNGATVGGAAGTISLDPAGAGPSNPALIEAAGSLVETRDSTGTLVPGNITRD